jgi:hypothetical protein
MFPVNLGTVTIPEPSAEKPPIQAILLPNASSVKELRVSKDTSDLQPPPGVVYSGQLTWQENLPSTLLDIVLLVAYRLETDTSPG